MTTRDRRALSAIGAAAVVAIGLAAASGKRDEARPAGPRSTTTATVVGTPQPIARVSPRRIVRRRYGQGASRAAVVRPDAPGPLPVVIFLHGWGYQQERSYRRWIQHLARRGNAVIVPRYQTSRRSDPARVRAAMIRGVRTALRHVDAAPGSLVVAGHSAGAALAADFAAVARARRLPRPRAVFAVYPGRAIIGTPGIPAADPRRIPRSTRLLVLAGERDVVVGRGPGQQLVQMATRIPRTRRRFVLVRDAAVSDHLAPLRASRAARRAFWHRLDRLIDAARS